MDKRPEAEIHMGAVLNAIEAIEYDLDDFIAQNYGAAEWTPSVWRDLVFARHHVFRVRSAVATTYDQAARNAQWSTWKSALADGHEAIKRAASHAQSALEFLAAANMALFETLEESGNWQHERLWDRIYERVGELPGKIDDAAKALTVAGLTAK